MTLVKLPVPTTQPGSLRSRLAQTTLASSQVHGASDSRAVQAPKGPICERPQQAGCSAYGEVSEGFDVAGGILAPQAVC